MWPWGHLAVGYLGYSLVCRYKTSRPPSAVGAILLVIGTQFPDLLGKPLAWTFGVLPSGRSLFHSVLTCVVILGGLWYWSKHTQKDWRIPLHAFAFGYVSHLFGDALNPLMHGEFSRVSFLLWPLLPTLEYETQQSFIAHFTQIDPTPFFTVQILLTISVGFLWIADGTPGYTQFHRKIINTVT